jgi:hypothetical protein
MSRRCSNLLVSTCLALVACVAATAGVFLMSRAAPGSASAQTTAQSRTTSRNLRNLFLQPEALHVARALGKRFGHSTRANTGVVGTLTISGNEQPVSITRRQTESGEQVDILAGSRNLTWTDQDGTKAGSGVPGDSERLLVERLTLDSPDQFVLAQLRGASYFTIARNVRPADAGDDYRGPLWTLVRVSEPPADDTLRPLSAWRIYYLNVQTGLPDRIEYQLNGQDIRVDFAAWTEQNGEKTPARITWSSGGQPVMECKVVSVSFNQ